MERSSNGASAGAQEARLPASGRLVDRLVATALVQALTPALEPGPASSHLADLADGRPQARSQLLRNEDGRPTNVTSAAATALLRARSVVAGRLQDRSDGNGSADG